MTGLAHVGGTAAFLLALCAVVLAASGVSPYHLGHRGHEERRSIAARWSDRQIRAGGVWVTVLWLEPRHDEARWVCDTCPPDSLPPGTP